MDPEQVDRPGRHVEPAEPEAPDDEQNLADYELKLDGHQSTEVSSPVKVAESEDPAVHDHSGPPLQNLEADGSDEEADVQLEPAEVENSGNEADVGQLEPAGVAGSTEVIVVQQVTTDEESSRAFSMEEPHADEDGAEEPLAENVPRVLLGEGVDLRERAEAVGELVAAGQAAIANLHRSVHALEAADVNLRDAMVGGGEWVAAGQAVIANLRRGAHALEAAAVYFRDAIFWEGELVAAVQVPIATLLQGVHAVEAAAVILRDALVRRREWDVGQALIANLRNNAHVLEPVAVYFRDVIVAIEAGFEIGADDNPAADSA